MKTDNVIETRKIDVNYIDQFLPKCDYVTFGYLLSQIRLSSVTFVHPTQPVEMFGNVSSTPLCILTIC